jgi:hypothetical protein
MTVKNAAASFSPGLCCALAAISMSEVTAKSSSAYSLGKAECSVDADAAVEENSRRSCGAFTSR